jgi:hypothetical protein
MLIKCSRIILIVWFQNFIEPHNLCLQSLFWEHASLYCNPFQNLCNSIKKSQFKHGLVHQTLIQRFGTSQNIQLHISENLFRSVGTFLDLTLSHIFPSHFWECVWILVYLILILNHFPYHALTFNLDKTNKDISKNIKQIENKKLLQNQYEIVWHHQALNMQKQHKSIISKKSCNFNVVTK